MIAPLRRMHRRLLVVLAVGLPVATYSALAARPTPPVQRAEPVARSTGMSAPGRTPSEMLGSLSNGVEFVVRWTETTPELAIEPLEAPALPGLLVYAAPGTFQGESLPAGSHLLGSLAGARAHRFRLPERFIEGSLTVLVYSLGHQEIVGRLALER